MSNRRTFIATMAALAGVPIAQLAAARSQRTGTARLAASWSAGACPYVGQLSWSGASDAGSVLAIATQIELPTRAHGLLQERGGSFLSVARRPGDWLLRWDGTGRALAWQWSEPQRVFNGHVLASPDGRRLFTTETDLDSGMGLVGVRDARSLEKLGEWPTHGIDPHQLLWAAAPDGSGGLMVANGGVTLHAETGRAKHHLDRMDSSLVSLDAGTGQLRGQWRLADPRLGLRHIAWLTSAHGGAATRVLGVALQAEHDAPEAHAAAPVLATFDGGMLRAASAPQTLAGYGGDIVALAGGFAVSCPRANGVALFAADGAWRGFKALPEACALSASSANLVWAGGRQAMTLHTGDSAAGVFDADGLRGDLPAMRLDNHWIALPA